MAQPFQRGAAPVILHLEGRAKSTGLGLAEMTRQLLRNAVNRCWQRRGQLILPPTGTLAAALSAQEQGDILISFDEMTATVRNFTARKGLYDRK